MESISSEDLRDRYRAEKAVLDRCTAKTAELLANILAEAGVRYHAIEQRVKSEDGFVEKLLRPGKRYKDPLNEIHDLCGCRIILFYQDDVETVARLISDEFFIVECETSHQIDRLDVDKFGYISLHYVVTTSTSRSSLIEWKSFSTVKVEIQIRTVLQHAWSAISHELQYKRESQFPSRLQRRLNRISGIFELADEEFVNIRAERASQKDEARAAIETGTLDVELTSDNIEQFVSQWCKNNRARLILNNIGYGKSLPDGELTADIYQLASKAGIKSLQGLSNLVSPPDKSYLQRILKSEKDKGLSGWSVSSQFAFLMMLILRLRAQIDETDLVSMGWDPSYASSIMTAANFSANLGP